MSKAILSHSSRPASTTGGRFIIWARKNLFSSWSNSLLTIVCLWLMWELIPPLLNWAFLQGELGGFHACRLYESGRMLGVYSRAFWPVHVWIVSS